MNLPVLGIIYLNIGFLPKPLYERNCTLLLLQSTLKQLVWEGLADEFASTWNNLLKYCMSVNFLLIEGYAQGALRKELRISPFVEHFKIASLERSW